VLGAGAMNAASAVGLKNITARHLGKNTTEPADNPLPDGPCVNSSVCSHHAAMSAGCGSTSARPQDILSDAPL